MKLLILGATGLLGNTLFHVFHRKNLIDVMGTVRTSVSVDSFDEKMHDNLIVGVDVLDQNKLRSVFSEYKPDAVVNCTGLTKHRQGGGNRLQAVAINSYLPHQLAALCQHFDARLIHFSTDCVFSGHKGFYEETDFADADDVYGRSKWLGEVDYSHAVTLRTSMIGPEVNTKYGLLEWFLEQEKYCLGYSKAIFSGLPTVELARIILDFVLQEKKLSGVYNVAADPISKYELLKLIAEIYDKQIEISPDDQLVINRSLNGEKFCEATGYCAPRWPELIMEMHREHMKKDL